MAVAVRACFKVIRFSPFSKYPYPPAQSHPYPAVRLSIYPRPLVAVAVHAAGERVHGRVGQAGLALAALAVVVAGGFSERHAPVGGLGRAGLLVHAADVHVVGQVVLANAGSLTFSPHRNSRMLD